MNLSKVQFCHLGKPYTYLVKIIHVSLLLLFFYGALLSTSSALAHQCLDLFNSRSASTLKDPSLLTGYDYDQYARHHNIQTHILTPQQGWLQDFSIYIDANILAKLEIKHQLTIDHVLPVLDSLRSGPVRLPNKNHLDPDSIRYEFVAKVHKSTAGINWSTPEYRLQSHQHFQYIKVILDLGSDDQVYLISMFPVSEAKYRYYLEAYKEI